MPKSLRLRHLLGFAVVVLLTALVGVSAPAYDEEEDATPKKPSKRVTVEDEPASVGSFTLADLVRAAKTTTDPNLKKFYTNLSVASDRINTPTRTFRVLPLPLVFGKDKFPEKFYAAELDGSNKASDPKEYSPANIQGVQPFERYAVDEAVRLISPREADQPPSMPEKLAAAERALSAVVIFHSAAVDAGRRRGPSWEPYKLTVMDKLAEVRISLVQSTAASRNWPLLRDQVRRFSGLYGKNPQVLQEIMAPRLLEAEDLSKSKNQIDLEASREIVDQFENQFPNANNEVLKRVRANLDSFGAALRDQIRELAKTDSKKAREMLSRVESVTPNSEAVRELRQALKASYNTLVVGVNRLPRKMSPATAHEDSEHMAVELMFEGLIQPYPHPDYGVAYRSVLADSKPKVSSLARDVSLVASAGYPIAYGGRFDSAEFTETLQLLRDKRHLPSAENIDYFDEPQIDSIDPNKIRVRFRQGHPDPRELLALKMLPAKWLKGQNKAADDDGFAELPFGSGPFCLAKDYRPPVPGKVPLYVSLVPNENYYRRYGFVGLPYIQEVRFFDINSVPDPVNELRGDRIHFIPDIPTVLLDRYTKQERATVVTVPNPRRMHVLALNHRTPAFQERDVRRGVSLAIDREAVLDAVYRNGKKEFHKALAGPFPTGSWATPAKVTPLFNRDLAGPKLRTFDGQGATLSLLYPNDDPQAKQAAELIQKQINAAAEGSKLSILLEPLSPYDLRLRVEQQHRFDLALWTLDSPDDWYAHALAAALDPQAVGKNGRNVFSYLGSGTNPSKDDEQLGRMLADVRATRDPDGKLKLLSNEVFTQFNDATPFVPLWTLDRHMAVSKNLKVYFDDPKEAVPPARLDPIRIFDHAERWKMEDNK